MVEVESLRISEPKETKEWDDISTTMPLLWSPPLHSDVGASECIHKRPLEDSGISVAFCIRMHFAIAAAKGPLDLRLLQLAACNLAYAG
jgi:hypothetical protein